MNAIFRKPNFYIWLVLVLLPAHTLITVVAFNMNTAAWVEIGRIMGNAPGADPEVANRLTRAGWTFYKSVFSLFAIEILALLAALVVQRNLRKREGC